MNKHLWQSKYRVKCNWQTNYQVPHFGSLHFINSKKQQHSSNTGNKTNIPIYYRHKAKESKKKKKEIKTPCLTVPSQQVSVEICRASAELNRCSAELANTLAQLFSLSQKIENSSKPLISDLTAHCKGRLWSWPRVYLAVMNVGRAACDWSKQSEYREAFTSAWRHTEEKTAAS